MDPLLELVIKVVGPCLAALFGWVAYRQHQGKTALRAQLEQVTTARLTAQRDNTQQHLVSVLSEDMLGRLRRAEQRGDELSKELLTATRDAGDARARAERLERLNGELRGEVESLREFAGVLQRQNLDQQETIERLERELGEERTSVAGLLGEMVTLRRSMEGTHSAGLAVPELPHLDAALERMKTNPPPPPP